MKKSQIAANEKKKLSPNEKKSFKRFRNHRIIFQLFLIPILPIFIIIHLLLIIYLAISRKKNSPLCYNYLKLFFKCYFTISGTFNLPIFEPPSKKPSTPTLFFTTRPSEIYTAYLSTIFNYQVSIPYSNSLAKFPIHHYFPFLKLGHFVQSFGYQDLELPKNIAAIKESLKNNIPTIIYINQSYTNPQSVTELTCYNEVIELLNMDINCYFLACKGFERYNVSSFIFKKEIKLFCISKEKLFKGIKPTKTNLANKLIRIMNFYGYKKIKIT